MRKLRMQKRNKGGFALAETVIALTVVLMVSAAALTVIMSSILVKATAINETAARAFASDALECFKVAETKDEFVENLEFAFGEPLNDKNADENGYQYVFDGFVANITLDGGLTDFEIQVIDKKGEEILSFDYHKGTGGGT